MPKILSYTPAWLSRPSSGFDLFSSKVKSSTPSTSDFIGPRRTIARRGTEIFVVVDNTIRWADLCMFKDDWERHDRERKHLSRRRNEQPNGHMNDDVKDSNYRTLKVPVSEQIRQLVISPNEELLAILTSHTVHVATLPDSSYLEQPDTGPIRLKTHTLGPTTHVLSQPPVISALWHPLGVNGECMVTVTAEAVVRLWELNKDNRWSFDSPALAFDLRKLQHGTSATDDFSASRIGDNRGFSVDALDMEVAAACFGGTGSETECGWSPMTLWVAMTAGDVYALCPLLPSRWEPPMSLIPSLTTTVAAKFAYRQEESLSLEEQRQCDDQYQWLTAIDKQEPLHGAKEFITEPEYLIYERPSKPGPIPRLQGPFRILPDDVEEDLELSDIHVIASKIDSDDLMDEEEEMSDTELEASISATVVNLLTRNGRVYVCLDLDGIEAQWLPPKKSRPNSLSESTPQPELILLEALETLRADDVSSIEWPTFSPDTHSRYSFFTSHSKGIFFFSCQPWLEKFDRELQSENVDGLAFRINVVIKGSGTLRERVLRLERAEDDKQPVIVANPIIIQDSDLGYFLLTTFDGDPRVVIFDDPQEGSPLGLNDSPGERYEAGMRLLSMVPATPPYQPPPSLWLPSALPSFLNKHGHGRYKMLANEEIRMSSATLDAMTEAHRLISHETHQLGLAAADIFRRCDRLRQQLSDQIKRVNDAAVKIEALNDEDADDYEEHDEEHERRRGSAKIEARLKAAKERQERIRERYEALKKKSAKLDVRELSDKEKAWLEEVKKVESSVLKPENREEEDEKVANEPWHRYSRVHTLATELIAQAKELSSHDSPGTNGEAAFKVPPDIRKVKVSQVMTLLERESALVDAAQERLERLSLATVA